MRTTQTAPNEITVKLSVDEAVRLRDELWWHEGNQDSEWSLLHIQLENVTDR